MQYIFPFVEYYISCFSLENIFSFSHVPKIYYELKYVFPFLKLRKYIIIKIVNVLI